MSVVRTYAGARWNIACFVWGMSYALYILGFLIVAAGMALGAYNLHVPAHWIVVGVLVLLGMAVASGVAKTRYRDPS